MKKMNGETNRQKRLRELKEARIDKNTATIEYIAMMTDVELPTGSEVSNDMVREDKVVL